MKVLFLYSYYKPEKTSGAHLAEDLRQGLVEAGHTIKIYTPTPTRGVSDEVRRAYKQRKNETEADGAIQVHRFALFREGKHPLQRAFRYALCELQLLWFGLTAKKPDLIPFGSTPPINGIVGTLLKKLRGIPYVYTVQDAFPESLVSTGMTREGSWLWKIGAWISRFTYRNAAHIITISESLKKSLVEKGVPEEKISVIHNWIDEQAVHPVSREDNLLFSELSLPKDKFYVTYAGNLGRSQNVELLVECAEKLKDNDRIQLVIFGEGSEKERLAAKIDEFGLTNVHLYPMQPLERVSEVYSLGDVSCVICRRGVGVGAFPSKAASIMATGTAVIASFDEDSDLCRVVRDENAGLCVEPENADAFVDAIRRLYEDRVLCAQMGENGRAVVHERFSRDTGVAAYVQVYEQVAGERPAENK